MRSKIRAKVLEDKDEDYFVDEEEAFEAVYFQKKSRKSWLWPMMCVLIGIIVLCSAFVTRSVQKKQENKRISSSAALADDATSESNFPEDRNASNQKRYKGSKKISKKCSGSSSSKSPSRDASTKAPTRSKRSNSKSTKATDECNPTSPIIEPETEGSLSESSMKSSKKFANVFDHNNPY